MNLRKAPDFTLKDQFGVRRKLSDYNGRWVVLFFYPEDGSLGCVRQTCNFRDEYGIIQQFGRAEVIGINKGSITSHRSFAEQYNLPFPLLSDAGHKVTGLYHAWRTNKGQWYDMPFGTRRNTYLINPDGYIVHEFLGVDPEHHVEDVIEKLQQLQFSRV